MMILYIYKDFYKNYYIREQKNIEIKNISSFLKKLAEENLMNIIEYNKATRKILGIKYNIPIYFNRKNIFFKIKDKIDESFYYINYKALIGIIYYDDRVEFIFYNSSSLLCECSLNSLKKQLCKVKKIENYYEKINN